MEELMEDEIEDVGMELEGEEEFRALDEVNCPTSFTSDATDCCDDV